MIALTTGVIFLFFIKQLQPSSQLWQWFLHENALFFSASKISLHLQNPQLIFSSLPLSCHGWTSSYPGRIAKSSYFHIFSQTAIYFQSYLVTHINTSVNQEIAHIYQADFSVTKELLNVSNSLHMANLKQWELKYYRIWLFCVETSKFLLESSKEIYFHLGCVFLFHRGSMVEESWVPSCHPANSFSLLLWSFFLVEEAVHHLLCHLLHIDLKSKER